jgi:hypothetical protein
VFWYSEVKDNATGLIWSQSSDAFGSNYGALSDAIAACPNPWRLPQVSELQTLVATATHSPAINGLFDTAVTQSDGTYWALTLLAGDNSQAWYVDFNDGYTTYQPTSGSSGNAVRCVR